MSERKRTYVRTRTDKAHISITLWICIHGYMVCTSNRSWSQTSVNFLSLPGESFASTLQNSTTISSQILTYTSFMATSTTEFYNSMYSLKLKSSLYTANILAIFTQHTYPVFKISSCKRSAFEKRERAVSMSRRSQLITRGVLKDYINYTHYVSQNGSTLETLICKLVSNRQQLYVRDL